MHAGKGQFNNVCKQIAECVQALLDLPDPPSPSKILLIDYRTISGTRVLDEEMRKEEFYGFLIHSSQDVLLAGLRPDLARLSFQLVARQRQSSFVMEDVHSIAPLIRGCAENAAYTFAAHDDYTAKFGYSTNQVSGLPTNPSAEFLARAIARGFVRR